MVPTPFRTRREALRTGVVDVLPMLVGIVPFGLVAGAAPVAEGMRAEHAVGFSTVVFAGASQLAAVDVLAGGGGVLVAALTAWAINLRLVLFSASLAPFLADEPLRRRLGAAYLLVDQNYAFAVSRWPVDEPRLRLPYYLAQGGFLWVSWQVCTVAGAIVGGRVPDDVPLDFALPLVFLVMLVPAVRNRAGAAAAVVGGVAAVVSAEAGAANVAIAVGCACGIVAGTVVATVAERTGAERAVS